jgi:2-polyprenyl-3-methyl-5-hydroxy-6-metoxy-1,4-benzoquinol methylase
MEKYIYPLNVKTSTSEVRLLMEINKIRPTNLQTEAKKAYEKDLLYYKDKYASFVTRACPACMLPSNDIYIIKDEFQYSRCRGCACIYMNPGPTTEIVEEFYSQSQNYKFWAEKMYPQSRLERLETIHQDRAKWVLSFLKAHSLPDRTIKILELGAGTGDTLNVISNSNELQTSCFAFEPNPSMKPLLANNNIQMLTPKDLVDAKFVNYFDVVICFEVLEHILEPQIFLGNVNRNLQDFGYFFATTPNAQSLEVQILREKSTTIDIEHISVLAPASIYALAQKEGFQVLINETSGVFDLELIRKGGGDIFLELEDSKLKDSKVQEFISASGFSSHQKVIMKKCRTI